MKRALHAIFSNFVLRHHYWFKYLLGFEFSWFSSRQAFNGTIAFLLLAQHGTANDRPNVIIILTDDQGAVDVGAYGATDLHTPASDELARCGIRFTQFYSAAPICSPSRAGLLTGRYPWQVGMQGNAGRGPSEKIDHLSKSNAEKGLHDESVTLAEIFAESGYRTAHIGKWHLGTGPGSRPLDQGFSYSFGHMGGCIDNYGHFGYWSGPNEHDLWENNVRVRKPGKFFPDLMIDNATEFIRESQNRPFFLYFACNAPHYPYQGDEKWLDHHRDQPYPRNLYAAFLTTLDQRIGQLLDMLDELGIRDNTIVVYQSDNGHSTEARAHYGGGNAGPYRGAKFSLFEGGIRMPAIISWPGKLPNNVVRSQLAHACDWAPTLLELCNLSVLGEEFDGHSLVDVLYDPNVPSPHDVLFWDLGQQWAVRRGPWKLIHNVNASAGPALLEEDREWFLSDLSNDPGETKNFLHEEPKVASQLRQLYEKMQD